VVPLTHPAPKIHLALNGPAVAHPAAAEERPLHPGRAPVPGGRSSGDPAGAPTGLPQREAGAPAGSNHSTVQNSSSGTPGRDRFVRSPGPRSPRGTPLGPPGGVPLVQGAGVPGVVQGVVQRGVYQGAYRGLYRGVVPGVVQGVVQGGGAPGAVQGAGIPGAVEVEQRTEAWHALRSQRLTASDFSKALGFWGTPDVVGLWEEKLGLRERFGGNKFTQWGERHEGKAVEEYERMSGNVVTHIGFQVCCPLPLAFFLFPHYVS